ncbi:hypothetical protein B0H14DRAFT_3476708 [Mycena olivaceomarginata]|nr:hypothetical protein B0H14DRAFT_3476708 [Mycena olivaceomarginata]
MTSRMNARRNFVHTIHDPSKSINLYISAIEDAVTCLNHLGVKPTNSEITDTLLMNLDESLSSTCTTILTSKKELTLTAIKSQTHNARPSALSKSSRTRMTTTVTPSFLLWLTLPALVAEHLTLMQLKLLGPVGAANSTGALPLPMTSVTAAAVLLGTLLTTASMTCHTMSRIFTGPPGKAGHISATFASDLSGDKSASAHVAFGGASFDSDSKVEYLGYHSMSA